jgi:hypothetical protein
MVTSQGATILRRTGYRLRMRTIDLRVVLVGLACVIGRSDSARESTDAGEQPVKAPPQDEIFTTRDVTTDSNGDGFESHRSSRIARPTAS